MYAEQPLLWYAQSPPPRPPHRTPDQRRTRRERFASQAVSQLPVGAGQLERRPTLSKRDGKFGDIRVGLKDLGSGQSQGCSKWLQLHRWTSQASLRPVTSPDRTTSSPLLEESALCRSQSLASHQASSDMFVGQNVRRRERTFIGSSCAACEEPLEHMLRGERVLQLTCGHISHEACFYEYIKEFQAQTCPTCDQPLGVDTSRGGNIDFDNINELFNSNAKVHEQTSLNTLSTKCPSSGDKTFRSSVTPTQQTDTRKPSRDHLLPEEMQSPGSGPSQYRSCHTRNDTEDSAALSQDHSEALADSEFRPQDPDLQSIVTSASRIVPKNPIPTPLVTVRSEFPTLTKSRHLQSLTCLITVEVPEGKWNPQPEDIRSPPPVPSTISQEPYRPTRFVRSPKAPRPVDSIHEDAGFEKAKEELLNRVDNWHGLEFDRFGELLLHGLVSVGKDRNTWQELQCYLFSEMLICVKEKRAPATAASRDGPAAARWTLKGSILIRKHLEDVEVVDENLLALSLSVAELPAFNLRFADMEQLEVWRTALKNIYQPEPPTPTTPVHNFERENSGTDDDEYSMPRTARHISSIRSSGWPGDHSPGTAPTEDSTARVRDTHPSRIHIPLDVVVVIPVSSSMQGLKVDLLRDALRFLISNLGERDRLGIVTFGSGGGGVSLVGLSNKSWSGWSQGLEAIRPIAHKNMRSDVVEGANGAMDMLMQRKTANALSQIVLISDSATSDNEGVDFVVSRAEAAKISIYSFGLGLTHKPDAMVEMSTRTKASYTYVKDWMMLRECLAGCLGALQSTSHQNVKMKLRLPEGSPAKFVKINGALQITKRATGRDAEVLLGDLRFGDKREVLVQLAVQPDSSAPDAAPADPWDNMVSGLEAMSSIEQDSVRGFSIEELPLLQADLVWGDLLQDGHITQLPRPSLLAITVLPSKSRNSYHSSTPSIPPHASVVQRRMELLTSDMLSRALGLVARGQHERAQHLLTETRSILKGLGKGGLPALPTATPPPNYALPPTPSTNGSRASPTSPSDTSFPNPPKPTSSLPTTHDFVKTFSSSSSSSCSAADIDKATMEALDHELQTSLEYILHPQVFARDARKAMLQAIGTISSQRGLTFRTGSESLWAARIPGVRRLTERSRVWRDVSDRALVEE
ncbi:von Willebrand RING finger domain-containing protein [Zymoseptoria brevis]|uniref:von Willebrand RING finger domain-containing protein n=1 Tax=Zymoseptoria brevis TaxID=1047168 RepID=A0A0F4G5Q3_9PEZI|nr:von Willebrand RING finger domain-containing protein [Zymoseptoria brevis]